MRATIACAARGRLSHRFGLRGEPACTGSVIASTAAASTAPNTNIYHVVCIRRPVPFAACAHGNRNNSSGSSSDGTGRVVTPTSADRIPGTVVHHPRAPQLLTPRLDSEGRFSVQWPSFDVQPQLPRPRDIWQWQTSKTRSKPGVPTDPTELDRTLPMHTPDLSKYSTTDGIHVTWLGHATCLVRINGMTVMSDPLFSNYASPLGFYGGPRRYRPPALQIEHLPKLDAVIISHNHYDHLDRPTIRKIEHMQQPNWYVPMGLRSWFLSRFAGGVSDPKRVIELTWWQEHTPIGRPDAFIALTPAQHWTRRSLTDTNRTLWGSYVVSVKGQKFWFSGDTGFNHDLFKLIGEAYGPMELAAIPIGAYDPRFVMKFAHCNPDEALQIHRLIKSKRSFGIHWGTIVVTDEPYLEPRQRLHQATAEAQMPSNEFWAPIHGQTVTI